MDNPARMRRRLTWLIVAGLLLVMPSAVALQLGAPDRLHPFWLALLAAGGLAAAFGGGAVTLINLRGLGAGAVADELHDELHDELAARNGVQAMAAGYGAFLFLGSAALPLVHLLELPALPVLTTLLLLAIACHLAAYALLERRGDE